MQMVIDPVLPLSWILGYVILSLLSIIGFVIKVVILEGRVLRIEKENEELKDKITDVEYGQKQDIKEVNKSLNDMWKEFHALNLNLNRLVFEKTSDKQPPIVP